MTRLSVNINKIALIRNSRGANMPDLVQVVKDIESFGADGITVHPRPDQRHIKYTDIPVLKQLVTTEFNIEGYPSEEFLRLVEANTPHQVTLVPDPPEALTSDTGWDTQKHREKLKDIVSRLHSSGIRVSLFLNPEVHMVEAAKATGADRIEFYTGPYAYDFPKDPESAVAPYRYASFEANRLGLGVNAGHDLNLLNLSFFGKSIENLLEVSIGHALICDALYYGMENTIKMYKKMLIL
jgi:pyridoxine 5-phosphate synthase